MDQVCFSDVFATARELGYEGLEIYSETNQSVEIRLRGRTDDIRYSHRRGTSLRCHKDGVVRQVYAQGVTPQSLICALKGEEISSLEKENLAPGTPTQLSEAANSILQTARAAFASQHDGLQYPFVSATLSRRCYQTIREDGVADGFEEEGEVRAEWWSRGSLISWERARGSIAGLVAETQSADGLSQAVKDSQATVVFWPVPQGNVSILWSARCVAKLQMLLLRAFEGDRVLDNRSFLTTLEKPLQVAFWLEDRPLEKADHEGCARKRITLLKDGRPTALACNKKIAKKMEVASTGHARRQSFESSTTMGFWHAYSEGLQARDHLLSEMEQGISVRDLEIVHYNPSNGELTLRLTRSFLIHQGVEGEPLEPVTLSFPLVSLMESLSEFEKQKVTTGLAVAKQNQRFYTEITTSAARSTPLPLPGSVPISHYW